MHTLDFKFHPHERIQIQARRDNISPRDPGDFAPHSKQAANLLKYFGSEKSDLAFVVVLKIKKTVAQDAAAGEALNLRDSHGWMLSRPPIVMPEKIVPGRNIEVAHFHGGSMTDDLGTESILQRAFTGKPASSGAFH